MKDIYDRKRIEDMIQELNDIRNKKYEGDEYYEIIMDYKRYDNLDTYTTCVNIEIPPNCNDYGVNWPRFQSIYSNVRELGIYAIKDKDGIHEMVTGYPLNMEETSKYLFCYGIRRLPDSELCEIGKHLQFLNNYPFYKQKYIENLWMMSNNIYFEYLDYSARKNETQQKNEQALQYLKNYKLPR